MNEMLALHRYKIDIAYCAKPDATFKNAKTITVEIEYYGEVFEKSGNELRPLLEAAAKWIRKQEKAQGMLKDFEVKPKRPVYLKPRYEFKGKGEMLVRKRKSETPAETKLREEINAGIRRRRNAKMVAK